MADLFMDYITRTVAKEGGERYTNDPADHGGPTKWGISENMARSAGYRGDMRDMDRDTAIAIYRTFYWTQPGFDRIAAISPDLAALLLDLGVNCGPTWPGRWVQRALNALNDGDSLWPALTVDGQAGVATRAALSAFANKRGPDGVRVLIHLVQSFAAVRYVELAESNPGQERFEYGWLSQRAFPAGVA